MVTTSRLFWIKLLDRCEHTARNNLIDYFTSKTEHETVEEFLFSYFSTFYFKLLDSVEYLEFSTIEDLLNRYHRAMDRLRLCSMFYIYKR